MAFTGQIYSNPAGGAASTVSTSLTNGGQFNTQYYEKKALIELKKEQYFSQLANTTSMPKNMGKKIVRYQYIPMLDDANMNDQGIDAAEVAITSSQYYIQLPNLVLSFTTAPLALAAHNAINAIEASVSVQSGAGPFLCTVTKTSLKAATSAQSVTLLAAIPGATSRQGYGNLYGSSKDVGTVNGKMPALSETGGRVNRVGFKRKQLEGSLEKFGFFDEYTKESLDFDSDSELQMHIHREMLNGANEITEDALQIDLLSAASTVRFANGATTTFGIGATNTVTYSDLMHLSIDLDNKRTPKSTTVITGTRMVDTVTIPACRVMYCGSELIPTLKAMKDLHNNEAFIPVQKYAAGGNTVTGEIGAVGDFRIVIVPEMMKWSGAGALTAGDTTCYSTAGAFDVFPMLVVGNESFTTIGFQTDGKSVKFVITHKAPGKETADRNDPYGETGFMSIKWYYGFMALRPERIGLIKTAANI